MAIQAYLDLRRAVNAYNDKAACVAIDSGAMTVDDAIAWNPIQTDNVGDDDVRLTIDGNEIRTANVLTVLALVQAACVESGLEDLI